MFRYHHPGVYDMKRYKYYTFNKQTLRLTIRLSKRRQSPRQEGEDPICFMSTSDWNILLYLYVVADRLIHIMCIYIYTKTNSMWGMKLCLDIYIFSLCTYLYDLYVCMKLRLVVPFIQHSHMCSSIKKMYKSKIDSYRFQVFIYIFRVLTTLYTNTTITMW